LGEEDAWIRLLLLLLTSDIVAIHVDIEIHGDLVDRSMGIIEDDKGEWVSASAFVCVLTFVEVGEVDVEDI
jgi:hypothetical protein